MGTCSTIVADRRNLSELEAKELALLEDQIHDLMKYHSGDKTAAKKEFQELLENWKIDSKTRAVQAVRDAAGVSDYCISIFTYGLDKADKAFAELNPKCETRSLLMYDVLLEVAKEIGYMTDDQIKLLEEWRADPFGWGEKQGFPKVEKK